MTEQSPQNTYLAAIQAYNSSQYEKALELFDSVSKQHFQTELSLRNKGLCEFKLRRYEQAALTLSQVQAFMPGDPMILEALGLSHVHLRAFEAAVQPLVDRLALSGELSHSCLDALLASCRFGGQLERAIHALQTALQGQTDGLNLRIGLARLLSESGRREQAVTVLTKSPHWENSLAVRTELGHIEKAHHRFQECEKHWIAALQLAEQAKDATQCEKLLRELLGIHSHAGQARGIRQICTNLLKAFPSDENRVQCLIAFLEKSLTQDADDMIAQIVDKDRYSKEIQIARARIARDRQDLPAAAGHTLSLLQHNPDDAFMICNLGLILADSGQLELAAASYSRALELRPDYHMAKWNLAIARFLQGDYKQAFELAEARWHLEHLMGKRPKSAPELQRGEQIAGKSILVYFEQGLGDTLQFCRFADTLHSLGAKVYLRVQKPLVGLISNSFPHIEVLSPDDPAPHTDRQIALLSIPYILHCDSFTIPAPRQYLKPETIKKPFWQTALGKKKTPRVGLAWSGSSTHKNDHNRSVRFSQLSQVLSLPIQFVAVQKDLSEEVKTQAPANLYLPGEQLQSFNDTAQLMQELDLIISVDSSPAHLAGSTGRPLWLLLPKPCDWRWKAQGEGSVWYQDMRIFRQDHRRKWEPTLEQLRQALIEKFQLHT